MYTIGNYDSTLLVNGMKYSQNHKCLMQPQQDNSNNRNITTTVIIVKILCSKIILMVEQGQATAPYSVLYIPYSVLYSYHEPR